MLFIGIYIDRNVIRISQVNPKARDASRKLDPRRRENYGLEQWYTRYQGSLPNSVSADGLSAGYDVLSSPAETPAHRLDEAYFKSLLSGAAHSGGRRAWRSVLREIRQNYLDSMEPAAAGIYLDGVDLTTGPRPILPWRTPATCKPDVERELLKAGHEHGIVDLAIVDPTVAIGALARIHSALHSSDLLLDVGYTHLTIWQVKSVEDGSVEMITKAPGMAHLHRDGIESANEFHEMLARPSFPPEALPVHIRQWRKETLLRSCLNAIAHVGRSKAKRLVVSGEGAQLVDEGWSKELGLSLSLLPDAQFLNSFAAAACAFSRSANNQEKPNG